MIVRRFLEGVFYTIATAGIFLFPIYYTLMRFHV